MERLIVLILELFEDGIYYITFVMSNNYAFLVSEYIKKDYMLNTPLSEQWLENYENL